MSIGARYSVNIPRAVRNHSHCAKICRFLLFSSVDFDINTSKRRCFTPQQVLDEIFADKGRDYEPDRKSLNLQSNKTSLQSNKDEDEADDEIVKGL